MHRVWVPIVVLIVLVILGVWTSVSVYEQADRRRAKRPQPRTHYAAAAWHWVAHAGRSVTRD